MFPLFDGRPILDCSGDIGLATLVSSSLSLSLESSEEEDVVVSRVGVGGRGGRNCCCTGVLSSLLSLLSSSEVWVAGLGGAVWLVGGGVDAAAESK